VRYLLRGVSDLSLRPAAAALGTTARMLIYYFGSRERLLFAAMEGR
jgi:AcrR family transcriptional regulator